MQNLVFFVLMLVSLSSAVPPSRYSTLTSRQEVPPAAPGPYAPSGWKPAGARLQLPARQVAEASYGPPKQVYGPPKEVYGPPTTTDLPATTDIDFTQEPEAENFQSKPSRQQQTKAETIERGQYYLLLPDGRLQRVQYVTSADLQKMAYSAKLKYMDVEPITGPIFTTANNQPFIPIFQK